MNAYLMCAGNGARLRPLTDSLPKCLLSVRGQPMVSWWLDAIYGSARFDEVFVNVGHLGDTLIRWIKKYNTANGTEVRIIDEREKLLGTAGTLYWYGDLSEPFMVAYADTYSWTLFSDLGRFVDLWRDCHQDVLGCLFSFSVPGDESTALIKTDFMGTVTSFSEKTADMEGVAWTGVMLAKPDIYKFIRQEDSDLARDVLTRLVGKTRVIGHVDAYDIGRSVKHYEDFNRQPQQASKR